MSAAEPRVSIVIDNYNYGEFIGAAIESALKQGAVAQEVIVVDDGSTDESLSVCREWAQRDSRVRVITKSNGGQLSALNAGVVEASGEIISFLDSDDVYNPGYLQRLSQLFDSEPGVDFVFCKCTLHGDAEGPTEWDLPHGDHCYGETMYRTLLGREWIGAPTSALSGRRELIRELLPCPLEDLWRIRADDVLVYGASVLGAWKYYLDWVGVSYRVHSRNHYFGKSRSVRVKSHYQRAIDRTTSHFLNRLNPALQIRMNSEGLPRLLAREFRTIPSPLKSEARIYTRLIRRHPGRRRFSSHRRVWSHYLKFGIRSTSGTTAGDR